MNNLFSKILFTILGISIGMYVIGAGMAYAAAFLVASGGTGTSSIPANQILTGNGTSAFNSTASTSTYPWGVNISTGCFAINGTCLSSGTLANTIANGLTGTTTFQSGYAIYAGSAKLTQDTTANGQFFWDATNHRLGIGTITPANKIEINGFDEGLQITNNSTTQFSGAYNYLKLPSAGGGGVTYAGNQCENTGCTQAAYVINQNNAAGSFQASLAKFDTFASTTELYANGTSRFKINANGTLVISGYTAGALTTDGSGNVSAGTLGVANGGTGAITLTGCLTGNGTGAITGSGTCNTSAASVTSVGLSSTNSTLTIGSTPVTTSGTITADLNLGHTNTWTILQNFSNASTSQLSVFQKAYFGGTATTTIDSTGALTVATLNVNTIPNATTTNFTASQSIGEAGNSIPAFFYGGFSVSTSTAWTGSTTPVASGISLAIAAIAETWDSVICKTNTGTVNVQFYNGATQILPMFNASTTGGTVTFTSGNAITAGTERFVIAGTPASSPVQIGCTVKKHYTF